MVYSDLLVAISLLDSALLLEFAFAFTDVLALLRKLRLRLLLSRKLPGFRSIDPEFFLSYEVKFTGSSGL